MKKIVLTIALFLYSIPNYSQSVDFNTNLLGGAKEKTASISSGDIDNDGDEDIIIAMLSLDSNSKVDKIVDKIIDCMSVNNLTAEMLLARFFDESVLGQYCHACLNKSAKGSSAILASRIAREWSKPNFTPTNTNITSSSKKQLNNNNNKGTESSDEEDYMSMIHASRNATLQKAIETDNSAIKGDSISIRNETDVDESSDSDNDNTNNVLLFQNIKRKMKKLKLIMI